MFSRLVTGLVLFFTCILGLAFSWHVFTVWQARENGSEMRMLDDAEGGVADTLSRLSLLPFGKRQRNLMSIIIENHEDARPFHQGLEKALLIQEYPVEGFITRLLATFEKESLPPLLGPVRSLRPYFVDTIRPWNAPIFFAGGSPEAFERAAAIESLFAINGLGHPDEFMRDSTIPAPHNLFVDDAGVLKLLRNAKPKRIEWPPYETGPVQSNSGALTIGIDYMNPAHNTRYTYDHFSMSYVRDNGGIISRAQPRNVLLLEIGIASIGEYGRLDIPLLGNGRAVLFRDGTVERGTWRRPTLDQWFTFENESGGAFTFAKGQTWITVIPSFDRLTWSDERNL